MNKPLTQKQKLIKTLETNMVPILKTLLAAPIENYFVWDYTSLNEFNHADFEYDTIEKHVQETQAKYVYDYWYADERNDDVRRIFIDVVMYKNSEILDVTTTVVQYEPRFADDTVNAEWLGTFDENTLMFNTFKIRLEHQHAHPLK